RGGRPLPLGRSLPGCRPRWSRRLPALRGSSSRSGRWVRSHRQPFVGCAAGTDGGRGAVRRGDIGDDGRTGREGTAWAVPSIGGGATLTDTALLRKRFP